MKLFTALHVSKVAESIVASDMTWLLALVFVNEEFVIVTFEYVPLVSVEFVTVLLATEALVVNDPCRVA